jgi:hypothetical protein
LIDINGREIVSQTFSSNNVTVGENEFYIDWINDVKVPNGVYLYQIEATIDDRFYQKRGRIVLAR